MLDKTILRKKISERCCDKSGDTRHLEKYFNDIKIWVKSLTVACPTMEAHPNCPVKDLRELPLAEKLGAVDEMSPAHLKLIICHHTKCMQSREQ